jgi:ABC-2 type transport system ATP-binding protein
MQQKLQIIVTIMHQPKLIILDEPFTGLDPVNTALVKDIILELQEKGITIIFSTHLMEQVEKLCESICLINKGQSVLQGNLREVKQNYGHDRIQLQYSGNSDFLQESNLIDKFDDYGNYVEIQLKADVNPQQLLHSVLEKSEVYRFEIVEPSLNEIFIETVKTED